MKKIGYLSFGHYQDVRGSKTPTARDAYIQGIELAEAAEELGVDGAYLRVHHFAPQYTTPWPMLAAMAARTSTIELGTGVIDMRYEHPLGMAEEAAVADLISGGRLQLGVSRGSPEHAIRGYEAFGYSADREGGEGAMAHEKTQIFRAAISGAGIANANPKMTGHSGTLAIEPQSPGLADRIWWGSGSRASGEWAAEQGMNLMSSTLLIEDTGVPFHELQAEQIQRYRDAWAAAGHERTPRVSVLRSIIPLVSDEYRAYFGVRGHRESNDQVGQLEGTRARFGKSYIGEPDALIEELKADSAVAAADTLLITVPNQLGVAYNASLLESFVKYVAPSLGWKPNTEGPVEGYSLNETGSGH